MSRGAKNNIRSFRYSDEIACILEQQPGESLNAKFEYLVEQCFCEIEHRQEALARVNAEIAARRETLRKLEQATWELTQLESEIQAAKRTFAIIERRAKSIAEKTGADEEA